ncbi:hypothetical protein [Vibrio aerogenes]|uniref:hypothetical protein n=1 Tax=Vibrio aerogenes TaxID=92172 RepID=UPI00158827D6|nr:hypothetical protein [Vibrio aerogenes]
MKDLLAHQKLRQSLWDRSANSGKIKEDQELDEIIVWQREAHIPATGPELNIFEPLSAS